MKNVSFCLLAASLLFASPLSAETKQKIHAETDSEIGEDGSYKDSSDVSSTDRAGTETKTKIREEGSVNSRGAVSSSYKATTSHDPEGMRNKTWSKTERSSTKKPDGGLRAESTARDVDQHGTAHKATKNVKRDVESDGTVETTVTEMEVTDPKGLMNKSSTERKKVTERLPDGTATHKSTVKNNGETVEDPSH